jgi:hypothetical protein
MYTIHLAEEKNGELQLQGVIEVHHIPAVGETLTHQTVVSGKMVKVYGQVVKVIMRPPEYHPIDAIIVIRVLQVEEVRPA